ncbi:MAG: hypothetical protein HQ591_02855 [candidate division Zixibacteria bacterium]|nr:hypothetical protein [Candidatus Tariuqbacter arcticus]
MEKCPIHDEAMRGLREDVHDLKAAVHDTGDKVCELRNTITGNGGEGLITAVSKNTDHRINSEKQRHQDNMLWKRVVPSVVGGVMVGIIMLLVSLLLADRAEGGILDSLSVSFAERRAQTTEKRDFEIAIGSGDYQVGYEREEGNCGWLYDAIIKERFRFIVSLQTEYSDRYRGVYDISWQTFKLTNQGNFRIGGSFAGVNYGDWKTMAVVEASFARRYISVEGSIMTDFAGNVRWSLKGGPRLPIGEHLVAEWKIDHWGDENLDYGGSKLVITVKFD